MNTLEPIGKKAREAARVLAAADQMQKNHALARIADALCSRTGEILTANAEDLRLADENGVPAHMLDRLALSAQRIRDISEGVREVIALKDPIGEVLSMTTRPNGLLIGKRRVPLGVIGIIYEARPNVTVDAAVLCLKSGNAVILRGGKEAFRSNNKLTDIMRDALRESGLPEDCISLVQDTSRESATELMRLSGYLDVLIPRGGAGLIRTVVQNATVPVIETGAGNCHIYVDEEADLEMAVEILFNAKCQRPSVCNAAESLLVSERIAGQFLPAAKKRLDEKSVEWRTCPRARAILPETTPAIEEDFFTEYNDYILSVKVVRDLDEAIAHINRHSTGHSEAIVTKNYFKAQRFLREVDSACVYVNASTRFTDGYEFGLGAEIGISTQKMHARGPMGLEALTSIKYVIYGEGQVR